MVGNRKDYNLLSLSEISTEYVINQFKYFDEVSAHFLYTHILKAVKEVISDDKIVCLMNLSQVLDEISRIKSYERLKNYQNADGIRNFNLVTLACKNKAIKVLEYIFSEQSQTLYNLSIQISGYKNESLLSVKDEFRHNAFYYAILSDKTDLLSLLWKKWQTEYNDEELDNLLSQSYKELKLRKVSLSRQMQWFVQSKILDLRFFNASTAGKSGTGNSWDQIKNRIILVVRYAQSVKNDYFHQDPDDKFILIVEFIAKNIHVLKSLLKSTYDRLPWEEIEFCLLTFIKSCKNSSDPCLVYNCVVNKKKMLIHLFNFSVVLDTQYQQFKNSNVIKLAKSVNLSRDCAVVKIVEANSEFRELYDDYEKIRDFCSLDIIKSYADLIESSDDNEKRRHLLVSRVLQVMGEHLKNTLDSPKLSSKTATALLSSLSQETREILTKLRDSLSHEEFLFIRSEIETNIRFLKNIQSDILRIKRLIPNILFTMRLASLRSLMKKFKLCKSIEDFRDCCGPYRYSIDLYSNETTNSDVYTSFKGDFERLEELLLCLDKHLNDKTLSEKMMFEQIYYLIEEEKQRFENLRETFYHNAIIVSNLNSYIANEINSCNVIRRISDGFVDIPLEAPSEKTDEIGKMSHKILKTVMSRTWPSRNRELNAILEKIALFLVFEMGFLKWIEDFRDIMYRDDTKKTRHRKLCQNLSDETNLTAKLSQLKEILIDFDLIDDISSADLNYFESNMQLRAVMEMLILDILGILENSFSRNPFFLDADFPLLTGRNLRNHLAHGNALVDVCLEESSLLLVYAKKILAEVLPKNNKTMDRVIKCDYVKLEKSIDCHLSIISNQKKLLVALEEGNMKDVEEYLNEGADVYGKDNNFATCLHFAAKAPDISAMKWILKKGLSPDSTDTSGQSVLHIAAKFNRTKVIRYLVEEEGMSLLVTDVNGKTPLHFAVENQSNEVVEYMTNFEICIKRKDKNFLVPFYAKFKLSTTTKDRNGLTPLHTAVHKNKINAASILLRIETNIDENKGYGNDTVLHAAAERGNLFLVKLLIEKKASVNSKNDMGSTPLHRASRMKHFKIVKVLVENGADVNAKDEAGITPLQNAARKESLEIVQFLLEHGADVNSSDYRQLTPLMRAAECGHVSVSKLLLQNCALVNSKDNLGYTPLLFAAKMGNYEIVKLLLNHKAIIDCKNNKKETALHLSACCGHKEIVELLLKEGLDINATEWTNWTPLHVAAKSGHTDIVCLLIDKGADINCKDEKGLTALHFAAMYKDRDMVESLLKKGADIRAINENGTTPLYLLIASGLSDLLTTEGRNVFASDVEGCTLLHEAALVGDHTLVEYCIENGCDINARTNKGLSALHFAVRGNHPKIVCLLLNKGAKIDAKNDNGETPLYFAVVRNCREIVEVLISHEMYDFNIISDDKIEALKVSVLGGYNDIVDILLQNYKFDIIKVLKTKLLENTVYGNHKHVMAVLLERGFEINGDAKPLHLAVLFGHYYMVELLLSKGANPNLLDDDNCTPLDIAVSSRDAEMVKILLSEKAAIRIESKIILAAAESAVRTNQSDIIKVLLQSKVLDTPAICNAVNTLLRTSAFFGSLDVTRYLVAKGADINMKDKKGYKPVHTAAEKGHNDIVEFYLNCENFEYETTALLLIAASNGNANVCELLLKRNIDLNEISSNGVTIYNKTMALYFALSNGHKDVLSILLHYGTYYNAYMPTPVILTKDSETIIRKVKKLFTAVENNMAPEVETLLKEEIDPKYCLANAKCVIRETVLHCASWKGHEKIIDILLKYNINKNIRTKTGDTPLHYAVKFSHFGIVKALLSNGAIYNALSQTENTPLEYATDREIRNFLFFLNNIFTKVANNDLSVLEDLKGKDEGVMRAVIRSKNQDGKTLIELAHICNFSKIDELQMLFDTDICQHFMIAERLMSENKLVEASLEFENLLRRTVAIFGADSQPVLDVKRYLAQISQRMDNLDEALHLCLEVYKNRRNSLGDYHVKTLLDETEIAFLLSKRGKTKEALQIFEGVRIKLKEKVEPDDLQMLMFEFKLSSALFEMQKFREVLKINNEVELKCFQKDDDEYRIFLARFRLISERILTRHRCYSEALEVLDEILEMDILTPYHPEGSSAIFEKAVVFELQERYDVSLILHKTVWDIRKSLLPVCHIDILESEFHIGNVLYRQGRILAALRIFLCLDPKIAVVSPDSNLMKANRDTIVAIKYRLVTTYGLQCVFDRIQKSIWVVDVNH